MTLRLFNTLTGQLDALEPADGKALRMYACGPTVYDYGHIGNFRTFLQVDILRRFLRLTGIAVRHVMNITDVDDKIIRNAVEAGIPIGEYTKQYIDAFFEDLESLRVERPEQIARATEHIPQMVALIEKLAAAGAAYKVEDGSWYFRLKSFPEYGKLSKKDLSGMEDGARVDVDEYEKDSARDFALWKAAKPGETAWDTPIGRGRPGWHIECSAMAMEYLGESFDLHAGGEDLMFPHHENEIAQSESVTHKQFARHWMHVRFLLVDGRKMSKSEGNFYTLRDLVLKGHKPSSIRYLLTSVPYRNQLNFTFDGLKQAAVSVERLRGFRKRLTAGSLPSGSNPEMRSLASETVDRMRGALDDDLNTAQAQAAIFEMVRSANSAIDAGGLKADDVPPLLAALEKFDEIFAVLKDDDGPKIKQVFDWAPTEGRDQDISAGLREAVQSGQLSDAGIEKKIAEMQAARGARDFKASDTLRAELTAAGILIENTKDGVRWRRK